MDVDAYVRLLEAIASQPRANPRQTLDPPGSRLFSTMSTTLTSLAPAHIKTRFLIISDTHSATPSQNTTNNGTAFRPPLPKADVLLHCGDLTMVGHLTEYEKTLDMLEGIDAGLKLVIAGNHDITLDADYYGKKGRFMHGRQYDQEISAKAKELWTGERAKQAGVTYLDEGVHIFQLENGANLRVNRLFTMSGLACKS